TINGVQQYTPDGRMRYDGLNISKANRETLGLPVSDNADLVNLGSSRDIQAYNPDTKPLSHVVAVSVDKTFEDLAFTPINDSLNLSLSFARQRGVNFGGLPEFATTDSGNYDNSYAGFDPNGSVKGTVANEIRNATKFGASYKTELFSGFASKISLFGDMRSGRPINFLMSDVASGRGSVFGVNRGDHLAYIPQLGTPDAADPLKFATGSTVVYFDSAATLNQFRTIVDKFGLPQGGMVPKGFGKNPDVQRFDLQLSQELPGLMQGHKSILTLDIANVGNLLNRKWGVVREYSDSRNNGRIISVQCADANGVAQTNTSTVCSAYRFSNASTAITTPTINPETSVWSIQVGLKYQF
ncbi:MAG: OAR protein, partial [Asticcacaulis sp.]